jgi:hypothetical protein
MIFESKNRQMEADGFQGIKERCVQDPESRSLEAKEVQPRASKRSTAHRSRTCNLRIRSPMLYPIELGLRETAKVRGVSASETRVAIVYTLRTEASRRGSHVKG